MAMVFQRVTLTKVAFQDGPGGQSSTGDGGPWSGVVHSQKPGAFSNATATLSQTQATANPPAEFLGCFDKQGTPPHFHQPSAPPVADNGGHILLLRSLQLKHGRDLLFTSSNIYESGTGLDTLNVDREIQYHRGQGCKGSHVNRPSYPTGCLSDDIASWGALVVLEHQRKVILSTKMQLNIFCEFERSDQILPQDPQRSDQLHSAGVDYINDDGLDTRQPLWTQHGTEATKRAAENEVFERSSYPGVWLEGGNAMEG
ncbi:hypothetical protein EDD15DRAFT_2198431 [Pisolithus albus]|nr:hypothetical protein EDD15DRAFT_2198431 [Pisolithus albus]